MPTPGERTYDCSKRSTFPQAATHLCHHRPSVQALTVGWQRSLHANPVTLNQTRSIITVRVLGCYRHSDLLERCLSRTTMYQPLKLSSAACYLPPNEKKPKVCSMCDGHSIQPVQRTALITFDGKQRSISGVLPYRRDRGHLFLVAPAEKVQRQAAQRHTAS